MGVDLMGVANQQELQVSIWNGGCRKSATRLLQPARRLPTTSSWSPTSLKLALAYVRWQTGLDWMALGLEPTAPRIKLQRVNG